MVLPADSETERERVPSYREATDMTRSPNAGQTATGNAPRSSSSPSTSHSYSLRSLSLEFKSYAGSSSSLPVFFTNSLVAGCVTWDISKPEAPKEISVTIEGWLERATEATLVAAQASNKDNNEPVARKPFYRDKLVLCPPPGSPERQHSTFAPGQYNWHFEFRIPRQYKPLDARTFHLEYHRRTYFDLPPTFIDRGMPYILQFAVVVEVKRGFMKLDNVLRAPFRHVPISIPDSPASPLRLDAFQHNLPLPPPDLDPDGYSTSTVDLAGTFNNSPFSITCHLYLPLPHQYITGSPINFFLKFCPSASSATSMSSSTSFPSLDPAIFDILSQPDSILISLARVLTVDGRIKRLNSQDSISIGQLWDYDYDGFSPQKSTPAHSLPYAARLNRRGTARSEPPEIMRLLQGEISLKSSILPDFVFPCLEVGYELALKFSPTLQVVKDGKRCELSIFSSNLTTPLTNPRPEPDFTPPHSYLNTSRPKLQSAPFLSVPVVLTNASRLGEPKPRSYAPHAQ